MKTGPRGRNLLARIATLAALALVPLVLVAAGFAAYVYAGVVAGGNEVAGTISGLGVRAPVRIVRDARGIPHVRAQNDHDLYFAEGYLQGSDRLFQLDVYRRVVSGRLSEIFGSATLAVDERARIVDVNAIARAQLAALTPAQRVDLDAFAAGINAAIALRPLPPEFRVLMYRPEPWRPIDSLIVSFSTVLALTDSWDDVAMRSDVNDAFGPQGEAVFFSGERSVLRFADVGFGPRAGCQTSGPHQCDVRCAATVRRAERRARRFRQQQLRRGRRQDTYAAQFARERPASRVTHAGHMVARRPRSARLARRGRDARGRAGHRPRA